MGQEMRPPPGRPGSLEAWEHVIETPVAGTRRPAVITIAGVLLIVAGAFAALAGLLILLTGDGATVEGFGADLPALAVAVAVVLALLEVAAGLLVLRCSPVGRVLGIVVAALGIVGSLASIATPQGIVTISIFGFVAVALVKNAAAFHRTHGG